MVALIGDAELDEGNVYEACRRAGSTICATSGGSSTTTASRLDGVVREGLWSGIEAIFEAFGWDVVRAQVRPLQRAAFEEPGGERLRTGSTRAPTLTPR
jgi:pyruvate dehydrogenase E1 component